MPKNVPTVPPASHIQVPLQYVRFSNSLFRAVLKTKEPKVNGFSRIKRGRRSQERLKLNLVMNRSLTPHLFFLCTNYSTWTNRKIGDSNRFTQEPEAELLVFSAKGDQTIIIIIFSMKIIRRFRHYCFRTVGVKAHLLQHLT